MIVGAVQTASNGLAQFQLLLTNISPGPHTITAEFVADAAYNGSTGSGTLTVLYNTIVTVKNVGGKAGQVIPLVAKLRRYPDAAVVAGETLTFKVNGTTVGTAITGSDGLATLSYTIPGNLGLGDKPLEVDFPGDAVYNASVGNGTLTIKP